MLDLDSNLPGLFTSLAILDNSGDFNAEIYTSTPSGDLELSDLINPETLDFQSVDVLVSSLNATSEIGQFAEVMGTSENDTLTGTLENDQLNGMTGDDDLLGEAGDDTLYGGRGLDILSGGLGNDYLSGDRDSDFLFGGAGADTFALTLSPPDAGFSADVVLDFNPLEDFLGLTGGLTEADLSLEAAEFEPGRIDTLVWQSASSTHLGAITDTTVEQLTGRYLEATPITSVA
ncbi:MAG: calcium-binding protein, partial [Microcoleaceae cyanobacterium]